MINLFKKRNYYKKDLQLFLNAIYTTDLLLNKNVKKPECYNNIINYRTCRLKFKINTIMLEIYQNKNLIFKVKSYNMFLYKITDPPVKTGNYYKLKIYSISYEDIDKLKQLILEVYSL